MAETEENVSVEKNNIFKCDHCGSSNVTLISDEIAVCDYCGSRIQLVRKSEKVEMPVDLGDYIIVSDEKPVENFKRAALIKIYSYVGTPEDITEAQFNPITTEYTQYLKMGIDYDVTYSASIGYKREETYTEYVKKHDVQTGIDYTEPVTRTRTVTDWRPFSGTKQLFYNGYTNLSKEEDDSERLESLLASNPNFDNISEDVNFQLLPPTDEKVQEVDKKCEDRAYFDCASSLPGDTYKDLSLTYSKNVKSSTIIVAPEYVMNYSHNGRDCSVRAFKADIDVCLNKVVNDQKNIKKEVEQKVKPLAITQIVAFALFVLCSIISFIPILYIVNLVLTILALVFFAVNFAMFVSYMVARKKINLNKQQDRQDIKKEKLREYLKANKFADLTPEEEALFNVRRKK